MKSSAWQLRASLLAACACGAPGSDDVSDDAFAASGDLDGDGFEGRKDCDEADADIHKGATERPNGVDDDCDGLVDDGTARFDDDGDGFSEREGDCDDDDATVFPSAPEPSDGIDHDCDGRPTVPETPGPIRCGRAVSCPSGLQEIGAADQFSTEYWDFTWEYSSECQMAVAGPFFARATSDLVSLGVTATHDIDSPYPAGIYYLEDGGTKVVDLTNEVDLVRHQLNYGSAYQAGSQTSSVMMPVTSSTHPRTGCVVIMPFADVDAAGEPGRLWMASRRYSGGNVVTFNFINVNGTSISVDDWSRVYGGLQVYLGSAGIDVGAVYPWSVSTSDGTSILSTGEVVSRLRRTSVTGDPRSVNVLFVDSFSDNANLLGSAGGVPGSVGIVETSASAIVIAVDPFVGSDFAIDADWMATVIAHETGHQLGLFHVSESTGTLHDLFTDTPECTQAFDADHDGTVSNSECIGRGAEYVMFWSYSPYELSPYNYVFSAQQQSVLLASPSISQ